MRLPHVLQITLSGCSLVGICLNPALAIYSGVGEVYGHAANEARRSAYVDILDVGVRVR